MAQKELFSLLGKTHKDKFTAIAIIIIIAVAGYFLVKIGYTKIRALIAQKKYDIDLNEEISKGGGLTLSESQYKLLTDKLYRAMKGIGTDEAAIYEVINSIKTTADLLKIISVFGIRDDETLAEWLYGDMNNKEIAKINAILAMKNIDYSF